MDFRKLQNAARDRMNDVPEERNTNYGNEDDEALKKLGRQVED